MYQYISLVSVSVDVGPHRDLVGDLTTSVRAAGLRIGYYHSLREWYHPLYVADQENNCSTTDFVDEIVQPTMKDIVMKYNVWQELKFICQACDLVTLGTLA